MTTTEATTINQTDNQACGKTSRLKVNHDLLQSFCLFDSKVWKKEKHLDPFLSAAQKGFAHDVVVYCEKPLLSFLDPIKDKIQIIDVNPTPHFNSHLYRYLAAHAPHKRVFFSGMDTPNNHHVYNLTTAIHKTFPPIVFGCYLPQRHNRPSINGNCAFINGQPYRETFTNQLLNHEFTSHWNIDEDFLFHWWSNTQIPSFTKAPQGIQNQSTQDLILSKLKHQSLILQTI